MTPKILPQSDARAFEWEVPPLESGDRLSRDEFERRYDARPDPKKAELVQGVVYVTSPIRCEGHGAPHAQVVGWLFGYRMETPGVMALVDATVRLDRLNEVQPDALLRFVDRRAPARSRTSDDDYVEGPPELVAEVAGSTASYDLHDKLATYERNGVAEYVVWRVYDRAIDWFRLEGGRYVRLDPDPGGVLKSRVFPGLWLDAAAMIRGDLDRVLSVLREGIASPAHAELAARLGAGSPGAG